MEQDNLKKYPNVLIISNDCLSNTENNGKTLANLFDKYPHENLAQLYFNPAKPTIKIRTYYRIMDINVLTACFKLNKICGEEMFLLESLEEVKNMNLNGIAADMPFKNCLKMMRDILWKSNNWKTQFFLEWLDQFNPQKIFFLAGDTGFTYDICAYISHRYKADVFTFITDDYFMKRRTISPFFWTRRNYLLKKVNVILTQSVKLFTISEEMQLQYKKIFNKESLLIANVEDMSEKRISEIEKDNIIRLVYVGSLYYGRADILEKLSLAIYNYNVKENKNIELQIYTTQQLSTRDISKLNRNRASRFCGSLDKQQLSLTLNKTDILVFIESFNKKYIEKVQLSFSTKIPEYLSLGKPVLAIGPPNIGSMKYLQKCAFCIYKEEEIQTKVEDFFENPQYQKEIGVKCRKQFDILQHEVMNSEKITDLICQIKSI
ncbi:MAG: hypothetical protein RSB26_06850 [Lachnospiraceae bacterium]